LIAEGILLITTLIKGNEMALMKKRNSSNEFDNSTGFRVIETRGRE
jgi:hypothetical protein